MPWPGNDTEGYRPVAGRPPPWTVHKIAGGYRADDANGQVLAYIYGRDAHIAHQAKGLTWDEARRIAAGIARLPELMAPRSRTGEAGG